MGADTLRDLLIGFIIVTKAFFAGEVVDGRPSPPLLALATAGYRIQSQTLQIPDRFGFFSPGPPRLQVSEASLFVATIITTSFFIGLTTLVLLFYKLGGLPHFPSVAAVLYSMIVVQVLATWMIGCCDRRRAPGYTWKDWKEHMD